MEGFFERCEEATQDLKRPRQKGGRGKALADGTGDGPKVRGRTRGGAGESGQKPMREGGKCDS